MIVIASVLVALICVCGIVVSRLIRRVDALEDQIISVSMSVARNDDSISSLMEKHDELRRELDSNMEDLDVAKRIEKKWDDAVQRVFDFDPLKSFGGNE